MIIKFNFMYLLTFILQCGHKDLINTILEDNTGDAVLVTNSTCTCITSLLLALDSWNNGRHNYYYYYYYTTSA